MQHAIDNTTIQVTSCPSYAVHLYLVSFIPTQLRLLASLIALTIRISYITLRNVTANTRHSTQSHPRSSCLLGTACSTNLTNMSIQMAWTSYWRVLKQTEKIFSACKTFRRHPDTHPSGLIFGAFYSLPACATWWWKPRNANKKQRRPGAGP